MEQWQSVDGYSGLYEVSDIGRVRSLSRGRMVGRVLKGSPVGRGYLAVTLSKDGKVQRFYVHHLVAAAFIGPRPRGLEVCHGGSDYTDNRAINLQYGTHSRNMQDTLRDGTNAEYNRMHCSQGHLLTPDNVRIDPNGTYMDGSGPKFRRRCRECLAVKSAADYVKWKIRHGKP